MLRLSRSENPSYASTAYSLMLKLNEFGCHLDYKVDIEARWMGRDDPLFFPRLSAAVDSIDLSLRSIRRTEDIVAGRVFDLRRLMGNRRPLSISVRWLAYKRHILCVCACGLCGSTTKSALV